MATEVHRIIFQTEYRDGGGGEILQRNNSTIQATNKNALNLGKTFKRLGAIIGVTFAVRQIVNFGKAVAQVTADFEKSMSQVQAVTGATNTQLKIMAEVAKDLGKTTQFSATQAADAMAFLGQAGFTTSEIIKATPGVLQLAAAGNLDLARAADIASNVLSAYNLEASRTTEINDILAFTAANSNTNVEQMARAIAKVGPVANAANIPLNDLGAAIGILGDAGVQSSEAGSGLRAFISRLVNPSREAAAAMKDLGISAVDTNGQMLPLDDIIRQLANSGATTGQIFNIFGNRAAAVAEILKSRSGDFAEFSDQIKNGVGTAARIAEIQMDNLAGSSKRLESANEGLQIAIGEKLSPGLRSLKEGAADVINSLTDWLEIPLSEKLIQEQAEVNGLIVGITQLDEENAVRNDLILQLNTKYPELLGNLNAETASNDELRAVLEKVNQQYDKRIEVTAATEAVKNAEEDLTSSITSQAEARAKINALVAEANRLYGANIDTTQDMNKQALELFDVLRKEGGLGIQGAIGLLNIKQRNAADIALELSTTYMKLAKNITKEAESTAELTDAQAALNSTLEANGVNQNDLAEFTGETTVRLTALRQALTQLAPEMYKNEIGAEAFAKQIDAAVQSSQGDISTLVKTIQQLDQAAGIQRSTAQIKAFVESFGVSTKGSVLDPKVVVPPLRNAGTEAQKAQKEFEKLQAAVADYAAQAELLAVGGPESVAGFELQRKRALEALEADRAFQEFRAQNEEAANLIIENLRSEHFDKIDALGQKEFEAFSSRIKEEVQATEDGIQAQLTALERQQALRVNALTQQLAAGQITEEQFESSGLQLAQEFAEKRLELERQLQQRRLAVIDQAFAEQKTKLDEQLADNLISQETYTQRLSEIEEQATESRILAMQSFGGREIELEGQIAEAKVDIVRQEAEKKKEIREKEAEDQERILQGTLAAIQSFSQFAIQQSQFETRERIQGLEQQKAAEIARARANVQSEEEERAAVTAIEEKYEERKNQIQREAAEKEKKIALVESAIQQSVAVIRAFAELGPIAGAVAAAGMAITLGQQIANIQRQRFAKGVIDLKGPGTETSDSIPGMLSRGESVMTADETRRLKPTFYAIRNKTVSDRALNYVATHGDIAGAIASSTSAPVHSNWTASVSISSAQADEMIGLLKKMYRKPGEQFDSRTIASQMAREIGQMLRNRY